MKKRGINCWRNILQRRHDEHYIDGDVLRVMTLNIAMLPTSRPNIAGLILKITRRPNPVPDPHFDDNIIISIGIWVRI